MSPATSDHEPSAAQVVRHLKHKQAEPVPRFQAQVGLHKDIVRSKTRRRRRVVEREQEEKGVKINDSMHQEEDNAGDEGDSSRSKNVREQHVRRRSSGLVTAAASVIFASSAVTAASSASEPIPMSAAAMAAATSAPSATGQISPSVTTITFLYSRRRSHQRLLPRRSSSSSGRVVTSGFVASGVVPPHNIGSNITSCNGLSCSLSGRSRSPARPAGEAWSKSSSKALRMISAAGRGGEISGEFPRPPGWNRDKAGAGLKQDAPAPRRRRTLGRGVDTAIESRTTNPPPCSMISDEEEEQVEDEKDEAIARPFDTTTSEGAGSMRGRSSVAKDAVTWTPKQAGQGSWDKRKAVDTPFDQLVNPLVWRVDLNRGVYTGDIKIKQPLGLDLSECDGGVCVSKVRAGSSAEQQGIRKGDRIVATSATLGDGLWEKNTVDGILSAVGTRLVLSDTVTLRVERPLSPRQLAAARFQETVTQTFEVTLERPPGLVLEQVWDSSGNGEPDGIVVAGITPGSPADLSGAVEPGDRVVAVSSSLGNNMWPYKRLEGVLSAIELHIGNTIGIRFQRVVEMGSWKDPSSAEGDGTIDSTLRVFRERGGARPTMASTLSTLSADVVAAVRAAAPAVVARRPSPGEAATAAAEAATAAATAAASSAGFVAGGVRGAGGARTVNGGARSDGKKEARTIVLERCAALVKSYGARRQAIAVDSLLERMEQAGVQMDARFLNCVLKAYLLCKEPQKAADTFHSATSIVWLDLPPWPTPPSTARGQDRRKDRRRARDDGYHTNTNANANATAGASPQEYELPDEFLQLKAGPPQELNGGLESAVSSWEKGTWVRRLSQMQTGVGISLPAAGTAARRSALGGHAGDCRPNSFLVATVVKAHGKRRRPDDACRAVLKMADWGLQPDAAVFNSLAAALVWNGRLDLAVEVVLGGIMKAWGVKPNQLSYNTVMDAYARAGRVEDAVKVFNTMKAESVPPDVVTTTILVKAQVSQGDVEAAMATLGEMMRVNSLRDSLDAFPFNSIIQGLMKTLQWEKAMDLFRSMAYQNVTPDVITFNSLLGGLNKARRPAIAVELFEEMQELGIKPDVYTYSSVANAYAKLGDAASALRLLSDMAKGGVKPNAFTCAAVMQACIKGGQPGPALEVHEKLIGLGGVRTDEVIRSLVVQARAMERDFDGAFRALETLGNNKIAFNHLLRECVLAGEWTRASEAVRLMLHPRGERRGIRFDAASFHAVSAIPRGYDGTEEAAWPRLRFLVETKDVVTAKGWPYSSTLYLAILEVCMSREDYAMAAGIVKDRMAGSVFVHPSDEEGVKNAEEKIRFKMLQRTGRNLF